MSAEFSITPTPELRQICLMSRIIDDVTEGRFFDSVTDRQWKEIERRAIERLAVLKRRIEEENIEAQQSRKRRLAEILEED